MTLLRLASRRTFSSLRRHRNYRLFFAGQLTSVAGTWMQNIAMAWLVVQLAAALARSRRRHPHRLPLRPVHGARPRRRRRDRPARQPPHRDPHADGADVLLRRAGRDHARRSRPAVGGLRDRGLHRHSARVRRAVAPEPDLSDGRPRRAAERGRAQLEPLQHRAHLRPGARRCPDRRLRRRLVLRAQHAQLPRRARRPARDARARPVPARRPRAGRRSGAARARASATRGATGPCW